MSALAVMKGSSDSCAPVIERSAEACAVDGYPSPGAVAVVDGCYRSRVPGTEIHMQQPPVAAVGGEGLLLSIDPEVGLTGGFEFDLIQAGRDITHAVSLSVYLASQEAAEWRRAHTWGGYVWPVREEVAVVGERGMTPKTAVLFEEIEWMLQFDVHPELICQELRIQRASVLRVAKKWGRQDIADRFKLDALEERKLRAAA